MWPNENDDAGEDTQRERRRQRACRGGNMNTELGKIKEEIARKLMVVNTQAERRRVSATACLVR